jgi:hypothetical protein
VADDIQLPDDLEYEDALPKDLQFDQPKQEDEGAFRAGLRALLRGGLAGFADTVAASQAGARALGEGKDPAPVMQRTRDDWNQKGAVSAEQHPVADFVGDMTGSLLHPAGKSRIGQVGMDMLYSGIRGAGEAKEGEELEGAAEGAELGGLTSMGGQAVGELLNFVSRPLRRMFAGRERDVAEEIARKAEGDALSDAQRARQKLSAEQAEAGRHASRLQSPAHNKAAGYKQLDPAASTEAREVLRHERTQAEEFLKSRQKPTLDPTRTAASYADEAAGLGQATRDAGKETWNAVKRDVKQLPGVNTALTATAAAGRVLGSPGAKLSFYQRAQRMLELEPQRWGRFANVLREAASKGEDSFAATDFVLSQQNQDYRELKRQMESDDE